MARSRHDRWHSRGTVRARTPLSRKLASSSYERFTLPPPSALAKCSRSTMQVANASERSKHIARIICGESS